MDSALVELPTKNEIRIMDLEKGDIRLEWDADKPHEVEAAREAFDSAKDRGMLFYKIKRSGKQGKEITEFDPSAERIVGIPPVRGG